MLNLLLMFSIICNSVLHQIKFNIYRHFKLHGSMPFPERKHIKYVCGGGGAIFFPAGRRQLSLRHCMSEQHRQRHQTTKPIVLRGLAGVMHGIQRCGQLRSRSSD